MINKTKITIDSKIQIPEELFNKMHKLIDMGVYDDIQQVLILALKDFLKKR